MLGKVSDAGPQAVPRGALWWGSGEPPASAATIVAATLQELHRALGAPAASLPAGPSERALPAAVELPMPILAALARHAEVFDDPRLRLACASGSAYPDVVRRRRAETVATPDLVVRPRSAESVAPLLAACAEHDVAVVPRGGGTSLSGGVDADDRGDSSHLCVLDLRALARVLDIDPVSRRVTVEPGVPGPALEAALLPHGLEVPHRPESFRHSTVGGWVATGALGVLVRSVQIATPVGVIETGSGPGASGGPDLLAAAAGGEGALGVVTRAELVCRTRPEAQSGRALVFRDLAQGLVALRRLAQEGLAPELCELSDEDDLVLAAPGLGRPAGRARLRTRTAGALMILGATGRHGDAAARLAAAIEACAPESPHDLGVEPARQRVRSAFDGAYVRDAAIEAGFLADRLDIACTWRALPAVREALVGALGDALGSPCLIGCRLTHPDVDGVRLVLRIYAPVEPGDEIERWRTVQGAAYGALLEHGAGLAPGRGVGRHATRWLARANGRTSGSVLRVLKDTLDPLGVLNPGVLVPPA
jgi:alkyldihydroxyacetonephosphate synthase